MTAPDPFRGVPLDLDGDVFAWLLGASDSAICVARLADGTFSRVNEAFERLTGFPAADLVGRQVVDTGLMEEVRRAHRRLELRTEGSIRGRETLRTASGDLREVDFAAQIVSVVGEDLVVVVMRGTSED